MSQTSRSAHLASIAYDGRLWDAYLEQEEVADRDMVRARIRFSSPEADRLHRTAAIIIEPSWEEAVGRAKAFEERQLTALLRSALPDQEEEGAEGP